VPNVSKMIQIRNVPDELHARLKEKAARERLTLSDYLLRMAEREAKTVSVEELAERARRRGRFPGASGGEIIRELRDEHS
jgi:plasmid stability protein